MHVCFHAFMHACLFGYTNVYTYIRVCVHIYKCYMYVHTYTYVLVYVFLYLCRYLCIYIYVHTCVYIYTHTHTYMYACMCNVDMYEHIYAGFAHMIFTDQAHHTELGSGRPAGATLALLHTGVIVNRQLGSFAWF